MGLTIHPMGPWMAMLAILLSAFPAKAERVVVSFKTAESMRLAPGQTSGTVLDAVFGSTELRALFLTHGATTVRQLFADNAERSEWGWSRTGDLVHLHIPRHCFDVAVPSRELQGALISELKAREDVAFAEQPIRAQSAALPNDSLLQDGHQYNMYNTGQDGGIAGMDINVTPAWDITTGSTVVKIGIVDQGVDIGHPEFAGRTSGDAQGANSHGTHVAGIAAAKGGNVIGVAGVNWHAPIVSRSWMGNDDDQDWYDDVMSTYNQGAAVVNHSYIHSPYSSILHAAFINGYNLNRVNVVAMGNFAEGTTVFPPGLQPGVIAVGAVDRRGDRWINSNYGAHNDLVAPGVAVWSTVLGGYGENTGTSMAAPHVTGAASLLLSMYPNLYNDDIEQVLRVSALDLDAPGWDQYTGAGLLRVRAALDSLAPPNGLLHLTATGGTDVATSAPYQKTFYAPLDPGTYYVRRHEIRRQVAFPLTFGRVPFVWGRGIASTGFGEWDPNWGTGWCEPVPGTITTSGCELRAYLYDVYDVLGRHLTWVPHDNPGAVVFGYSALGQLPAVTAVINGPTDLYKLVGTWTAVATGGNLAYAYEWRTRGCSGGTWSGVVGTGQQYSQFVGVNGIELQVKVTSAGQEVYDSHKCSCETPPAPVVQGSFASASGTSVTQLTYDLTLTAAMDQLVLVYVGSGQEGYDSPLSALPTAVTLNGALCTLLGAMVNDLADPEYNQHGCYGSLYYIKDANLPGPGTYTVTVDFGMPTNVGSIAGMASNVKQSSPFGVVSTSIDGPPAMSIATDVAGCVTSGLVIDMVVQDGNATPGWAPTFPQQLRGSQAYNDGLTAISVSDRPSFQGVLSMSGQASPMIGQALAQLAVELKPGSDIEAPEEGEQEAAEPQRLKVDGVPDGRPIAFGLDGARPNPASSGRLMVHFALPNDAPATLELLDITGRLLERRMVGPLGAGRHSVDLRQGHELAAGVYLVRLTRGTERRVMRTVVLE